ncbi:Tnks, partial [Symbiodinium sp. CCMP2456]
IARDAVAKREFAGMLVARDERGRSPLHVAATRGDLRLCREMIQADPGLVNALDKQKNTPVMDAAFLGRAMIVKELIENAAEVTQKNADLMNPLQLACVNEGAGNGDVVAALIEALADPSDMCWQTTPLMAAADSGHIWALHALIDLGSDPWQMNGSGLTALDYARDMETAEFLYGLMEGDKLSDKAAPRIDTSKLFKDAEARRARLHRAAPQVSLEDAFATLEAPREWLPGFRDTGEHFNDLRKAWRRICLRCHPDKQPEDLEEEAAAEWTAQFQAAVAAFEAIDKHFRSVCQDEELLPEVLQVLADHHLLDGKVVPSRFLSPVVSHCLFVLGCEGVDLGVQRGSERVLCCLADRALKVASDPSHDADDRQSLLHLTFSLTLPALRRMLRAPTEDVFRRWLRLGTTIIPVAGKKCMSGFR